MKWIGFLILFWVGIIMWSSSKNIATVEEALEELGPCFGKTLIRGHYSPFGRTLTVSCETSNNLWFSNE